MAWIEDLDTRFYPDLVDEHRRFDATVRRYIWADSVVLEAGAGRGLQFPHSYRDDVARVAGVDLDPSVLRNECLTDAVVADLAHLPYADGEFTVVFSKYVFEHLERPAAVLRELRRVMEDGAHLLIHTPNRSHYVALFARLTPTSFHVWFNQKLGRDPRDTFPTCYRSNTASRLRSLAQQCGFRVVAIDLIETKPHYLSFHPAAYRVGVAYERLVNRSPRLARFRAQIIADLEAV